MSLEMMTDVDPAYRSPNSRTSSSAASSFPARLGQIIKMFMY
jgi:hypothetical protein